MFVGNTRILTKSDHVQRASGMSVVVEIRGHEKDLGGGFRVSRLLPSLTRQSVGPFVFFDHFGPVTVGPGSSLDVRPHPHIGIATVTFLFDGALMHRDSLGNAQRIEPGAINWMTAGRGIVHSERQPDDLKDQRYTTHGIQLWAALPRELEESEPSFAHTPARELPRLTEGQVDIRVLIGSAFGRTSPVKTCSPTLYLALQMGAGAAITLPVLAGQLAAYPVDADIVIDERPVSRGVLAVLDADRPARLRATNPTQVMLIGGHPLDGRRLMWWNFVSSRKERIVQAADDWAAQRFGRVEGDEEFIPLPGKRPEL
jgi:redox-sensitive bicupin YhaK (pirin superfamily)